MRLFALFALTVALAGCESFGTQVAIRPPPQFQKGVTTEAEVVAALGQPNATLSKAKGSTTIAYWHVGARPNAADFASLVGAAATTVSFTFGRDGKLVGYTSTITSAGIVN